MLFVTWLHDPFRPTRDLDLLGYGANDAESIADTLKAICSTEVPDDGALPPRLLPCLAAVAPLLLAIFRIG